MVGGKVRSVMGFHKSPSPHRNRNSNNPKAEATTTTTIIPPAPPLPPCASSSATSSTSKSRSNGSTVFSRSFGIYFPRSSSAQVQPRPPDVADLIRLVEELRDRESRLKTELLELKIVRETASIVPVLESEISNKNEQLDKGSERIWALELENDKLKEQVREMREEMDKTRACNASKVEEMEREMAELKKNASDKEELKELSSFSTSQRFLALNDMSYKSTAVKSFKRVRCTDTVSVSNNNNNNNNASCVKSGGDSKTTSSASNSDCSETEEREKPRHSRCNSEDFLAADSGIRPRVPRVPKPPPKRSFSSSSLSQPPTGHDQNGLVPPPPPPPRHNAAPPAPSLKAMAPPPPPPPPPLPPVKGSRVGAAKVRRVPEVVEFYHSLMRRDSRKESNNGGCGTAAGNGGVAEAVLPATANARDMIGEIENRSAHLLAIKTDVETQGDFIGFLIKEVETAAFCDIEDVVPFVKWLDDELSYLVDERAVLKHFEWPEQKADALREAAFGYSDLNKLESEASSFKDDPRHPCAAALKKIQSLLEKLEQGVYNLSRMRESATNRFKSFHIPLDWMLETGIISQIKLASVKLAMKYMKRVSAELETVGGGPDEEELIVQGVRFAFRVHQFAGGFDVETMKAFQELRDKARSCHVQCQNHQQQKIMCRSTTC